MSKQAESVAEILARRKAEAQKKKEKTATAPKKESKPATKTANKKKTGAVASKKPKKTAPKPAEKRTFKKKPKNDIENLMKPDIYLAFVRFLATPDIFRTIDTQEEFAKEFGVHRDTLTDWKKRDGFWDRVSEERRIAFKDTGMVNKIIQAVYRKVLKDGTSREAKLLLELAGEYQEKRVIDTPRTLSPERAAEIGKRVKMWEESLGGNDDEEENN